MKTTVPGEHGHSTQKGSLSDLVVKPRSWGYSVNHSSTVLPAQEEQEVLKSQQWFNVTTHWLAVNIHTQVLMLSGVYYQNEKINKKEHQHH